MRKILKRILCLSLVILMLVPLLVACRVKKEGNKTAALDLESLAATMPDDGVGIRDYGGRTIRFLGWEEGYKNEFEVSEEEMQASESTLKQAIYMRNEAVKGRLNVDLQWSYSTGLAGTEDVYVSKAKSLVQSQKVDILASYSRVSAMLMLQGLTQDLKSISTIDLSDPWWSSGILENSSVNNRIYFAAGDISWTLMGNTIAFCYNKNIMNKNPGLLDQFEVDSMYELVMEGKWTLESMRKLAQTVATGRVYGITGYAVPTDAFYKGCDLDYMEVDPTTGNQIISPDQNSGKANSVVSQMTELFTSSASAVRLKYDQTLYCANTHNDSNPINPEWQSGKSLFVFNPIVSITDYKFNELSFDFGVLPMPKYDEEQTEYKTIPDFEYSTVSVPRQISKENAEIYGAVLTVMASEGFMRTARAYYSEVLKKQSSNNVEDYNMWDTIKDSIDLDGGRLFDNAIDKKTMIWGAFRGALQDKADSMTSNWEASKSALQAGIDNINAAMARLESN